MTNHTLAEQLLIDMTKLSDSELERYLQKQEEWKKPLEDILIEDGIISEQEWIKHLGNQLGYAYVDLKQMKISQKALKAVSEDIARRYEVIPINKKNNILQLAVSNPLDLTVIDDISLLTGCELEVFVAPKHDILWAITRYYVPDEALYDEAPAADDIETEADIDENDGPATAFVHTMINKASIMGASDIHIEPHEKETVVRFRIDGVLYDIMQVPQSLKDSVVSRLKIMAHLQITEKRKPQDGSFHLQLNEHTLDIRMSTIATLFGEKVVLRLLEKESGFTLEQLQFTANNLQLIKRFLRLPHGMILVTGPTGSGKTTTLYSMLSELNAKEKNIVTIEDPVEYTLPRVNQTQINPKAGITFPSSLRSILRQDPDVIMVGEIRDDETAKISVQAALTGHLVLSTLHTNTALGSIERLMNMNVEPYLIAATVKGVIAQRLVRKICPYCKIEIPLPEGVLNKLFSQSELKHITSIYQGEGCFQCQYTGYKGRISVQEVIAIDDPLAALISDNEGEHKLKQKLSQQPAYFPLKHDCLYKLKNGDTTIDEVLRVIYT